MSHIWTPLWKRQLRLCLEEMNFSKFAILTEGRANLQFCRGVLLHDIADLGVEDEEQGFVGEAGDFVADSVDVFDRVAFRESEVWH